MIAILVAPLVLQALVMAIDEGWFHRRRGLPRWERIGHPLDTATVLACLVVALTASPTGSALRAYVGLAAFSCLFVTKDEAVHARACTRGENALHALLFFLHPIVLGAIALLWMRGARAIVAGQVVLTVAFGAWQVVYWNLTPRQRVQRALTGRNQERRSRWRRAALAK